MRYWVLEVVELDNGMFVVEGTEFVHSHDVGPDEVSDVDTFGEYFGYETRAEAQAVRDEIQPAV